MYKRHKRQILLCVIVTTAAAFMFDLSFEPIAEVAVTVASIAMGVYIAAVSALLGSQYAKELKETPDKEQPTKTLLGVLAGYFRYSGISCILLIVVSCLFLIPSNISFSPLLLKAGGAVSYGLFSSNILLLWLILLFFICKSLPSGSLSAIRLFARGLFPRVTVNLIKAQAYLRINTNF